MEAYAYAFGVYIVQFNVSLNGAELLDVQRPRYQTGFNKIIAIVVTNEMFDCLVAVTGQEVVFEKNMRDLVREYMNSHTGMLNHFSLSHHLCV